MWRYFLCLPLLLVAAHGCGEVSPRAEVVCYNKGDAHLSSLDPCKCTILIATDLALDDDLRLTSNTDFTKLRSLKKTNPKLKLLASLGGSKVKAETFSLVTSSVEGVANFTEGLISFVATNQLDGIEIDWRWPGQHGGRKEIDDVSTLMKVVRLALDQRVHSVSRRDTDEVTTDVPETTLKEEEEETETTISQTEATTEAATEETTTTTTATTTEDAASTAQLFEETQTESVTEIPRSFFDYFGDYFGDYFAEYFTEDYNKNNNDDYYYYEDYDMVDINATTTQPDIENLGSDYLVLESGSEYEVTLRPTQPEDYYKLTNIPTTTTVTSTTISPLATTAVSQAKSSSSRGWKLAKNSLRGQKRGEASSRGALRRPLNLRKTPQTILMMTLAPYPEYIVKGYDLKTLSKIVDLFSLPTHNLTEKAMPDHPTETYHHSRLMGVSDLQNADSLVDLVVSLGVPLDHLILGLPSTAAIFTLEDPELNTPRSPAVDVPEFTAYRKACVMMESGNWTVERDEDLTGPYAFLNETWIAFDDPTSAKIKVGQRPLARR